MAEFEVKVLPITTEEHPNADAIELAIIGDYRSIVAKDQFEDGDLVAYIPEGSIVPDWILEQMNLTGKLAGKDGNRVKAIRLRGIVSQGLAFPIPPSSVIKTPEGIDHTLSEGDDVAEILGITKYEPPIPIHMAGEVRNTFGYHVPYDIENIKKFPDAFEDGEQVIITEKLHGTWCCWGWVPELGRLITSKGLNKSGLSFKLNEANQNNLYIKTLANSNVGDGDILERFSDMFYKTNAIKPIYLFGEIFGGNVQDLKYGLTEPQFRLFDIYIGDPNRGGCFVNHAELQEYAYHLGVETVPVLYEGPYSKEILLEHTNGKETISGDGVNIREGVAVRPITERRDPTIGRVLLKSVSDAYLLRKNATEYN